MSPAYCAWCGSHYIDHSDDLYYELEHFTASFTEYTCQTCGRVFLVPAGSM